MAARINLTDFVNRLSRALNLPQQQVNQLNRFFERFDNRDRFRIINGVQQHVVQLEQADLQLARLIAQGGVLYQYADRIQRNWDDMNEQLAQLQVLSLIQRVENCDEVINQLLQVLGTKIRSVNQILEQNLNPPQPPAGGRVVPGFREVVDRAVAQRQGGGSDDKYMTKYLKYKNKYLSLKKMI